MSKGMTKISLHKLFIWKRIIRAQEGIHLNWRSWGAPAIVGSIFFKNGY